MASEYTPNYNLDLYASEDKPNLRDQYNAAMGKIDTQLKTNADGVTNVSASVVAATTAANEAKQLAEAAAPEDHASATTNYGIGNSTEYGHIKLVDGWSYGSGSDATAGIAPSPKAIEGVISTQAAPQYHALSSALYGAASSSLYGHVKLTDLAASTSPATSGVAATPLCVDNKISNIGSGYSKPLPELTLNLTTGGVRGNIYLTLEVNESLGIATLQLVSSGLTRPSAGSFTDTVYTIPAKYAPKNKHEETLFAGCAVAILTTGEIVLESDITNTQGTGHVGVNVTYMF